MGARGPAPKRSDQRRRTNSPEADKAPSGSVGRVRQPRAKPYWHDLAKEWYRSLAGSGQAAFYEPSDWATAQLIAESIHRELSPQPIVTTDELGAKKVTMMSLPPKSGTIAAWLKAMTDLMATEGARRRAQLELQKPQPATPAEGASNVSHLDERRSRFA